jgi:hypothetical protein
MKTHREIDPLHFEVWQSIMRRSPNPDDRWVMMAQVLEALSIVIRMAMKFMHEDDRIRFAKQMRRLLPGIKKDG